MITSTFSTCIVFLPLAQTSGIAYAILGDLAKAGVFSHAFSAVVALVLVPIVRTKVAIEKEKPLPQMIKFQNWFDKFKDGYVRWLGALLEKPNRSRNFCLIVLCFGVLTVSLTYPFIRKEIVALPVTDYIWVQVRASDFNSVDEMARELRRPEQILLQKLKPDLLHTFVDIQSARRAGILIRIANKNKSEESI